MKIRNKILLGFWAINGVLVVSLLFSYIESQQVEMFRITNYNSNTQLLAATDLRAKVRNQILETFEAIFVSSNKDVAKKIDEAKDAVAKKFMEYEKSLALDVKDSDTVEKNRIDQIELEELNSLHASYDALNSSLDKSIAANGAGKSALSKSILISTKENLFKKDFLKKITGVIEREVKSLNTAGKNLEIRLQKLKLSLLLSALFSIGLSSALVFYFSRLLGTRLKLLESATKNISNGDFSVSIDGSGQDEISVLSRAFNLMISSLLNSKKTVADQQKMIISTSKMLALGEMAGGIAHEINNPLAIIHGKSNQLKRLLAKETIDLPECLAQLTKIEVTTERIAKIIRGLRAFSRNSDADPMENFSILRIFEDTLELCKDRFKNRGTELKVNCTTDELLECRASEISQILMNLLGNALEAVENLPEKWVELDVKIIGGRAEISVTDSGLCIEPKVVDKMMQPFYTTKEVGKGTGLGLSISKGLAESHQGELFYDDSAKHTRFVLRLPLRQSIKPKKRLPKFKKSGALSLNANIGSPALGHRSFIQQQVG